MEDDVLFYVVKCLSTLFQSTSPVWRTTKSVANISSFVSISIHVPRVEDDFDITAYFMTEPISIHVPRVEDDVLF